MGTSNHPLCAASRQVRREVPSQRSTNGTHAMVKSDRVRRTEKRAIYSLYLRRADHIDNWDLVDISMGRVVGA